MTSNSNPTPSTSKASSSFASLTDILSSGGKNSRSPSRSTNSLLPSLEDLERQLDGHVQSNTRLNFSRAFDSNSINFSTEPDSTPNQSNLQVSSSKHSFNNQSSQFNDNNNSNNLNNELLRPNNRLKRNKNFRDGSGADERLNFRQQQSSRECFSAGSARDIVHIINQIEKKKSQENNTNIDNDSEEKFRPEVFEFNFIQLPDNFDLENAQLNVYESGIMEIVSGVNPSVKYRMKRLVNNGKTLSTDLVIANDNSVYLDRMNVLVPDTFNPPSSSR